MGNLDCNFVLGIDKGLPLKKSRSAQNCNDCFCNYFGKNRVSWFGLVLGVKIFNLGNKDNFPNFYKLLVLLDGLLSSPSVLKMEAHFLHE